MPDQPTSDPTTAEGKVFAPVTGGNTPAPTPPTSRGGVDRVLNQIEGAADHYSPEIYYDLLTYYTSLRLSPDLNRDFVPVYQTKPNPKIFAVGIIPPSARISGRTLDRSASIASVSGNPIAQLDFSGASGASGTSKGAQSTGKAGSVAVADPDTAIRGAALPQTFWVSYVQMCQRLRLDPIELASVLNSESNWNPAAQNFPRGKEYPPAAQGLNQLTRDSAVNRLKMPVETWDNFATLSAEDQLPWVEKYLSKARVGGERKRGDIYRANFGGYHNPDGSLYASKDYIASRPDADKFLDPDKQQLAITQNPGLVGDGQRITVDDLKKHLFDPSMGIQQQIKLAQSVVSGTPPPPTLIPTPPSNVQNTNGAWATQGSSNAVEAKNTESKISNTNLNQTDLGRRFLQAQDQETKLTAVLLDQMQRTPPLRLLVNPSSFKLSSEKIVADGNWTRNGPVIEHWGEQLDKIEANGKVAAFLAIDANSPDLNFEGGPGLTRVARQYSASYQNFLALYLLYRSNGHLFTAGQDNADTQGFFSRLSLVGSIYLYYDNTLYIGSFDSFNITETDTAPYSLEYNFTFTARATFLLDRPDEYDYGMKKMFFGDPSLVTTQGAMEAAIFQGTSVEQGGKVALPPEVTDPNDAWWEKQQDRERYPDWLTQRPLQGDETIDPSVMKATQPTTGQVAPKPTKAQRAGKK